jgi:hypothetical protein
MGTSYLFHWYWKGTLVLLVCCSLRCYLCWLVLTHQPNGLRTHRTDFLLLRK